MVENMAYLLSDGKELDIFGRGGGRAAATELGVPFLGEIPIDPAVAASGDAGMPIVAKDPDSPAAAAFRAMAGEVARQIAMRSMATAAPNDLSLSWKS